MKILPIAIALTLLPIPAMAQQLPKLPEQYYLETLERIIEGASEENQTAKTKNNLDKIKDGKDACLYIRQFSVKSYLKAKIYEADNRSAGDTKRLYDHFLYSFFITKPAINFFCPQHKEEYNAVSDRMNKEGLVWLIQD